MHTTNTLDADRVLREFARLLAPYIADELERPRPTVSPSYDAATCTLFVNTLGTGVLERAFSLFDMLAAKGRVSSVELAPEITTGGPRAIGGALTSPLKRRAKQLGLPLPFLGGEGAREYGGIPSPLPADDPRRTYWQDHDGVADRMMSAIKAELDKRPEAVRAWRFTWREGDLEHLTPEQAHDLMSSPGFQGPKRSDNSDPGQE